MAFVEFINQNAVNNLLDKEMPQAANKLFASQTRIAGGRQCLPPTERDTIICSWNFNRAVALPFHLPSPTHLQ